MLENFPKDPQAVTAQWLTEVLYNQKIISQGEIASVQVSSMQEVEGNIGQIVRLNLEYRQPVKDAPMSLIGKFSTTDLTIRNFMNEAGIYEREVGFYKLIGTADLPIPRCYYSAVDIDSGICVLLLEDLGHLRVADIVVGASPIEAKSMVEGLATLHAKWWEKPQLETMSWLPSFNQNAQLLQNMANWETFLHQVDSLLPDFRLSESFLEIGQNLDHYLDGLCSQLTAPPLTCIHSDTHLDNLLFGVSTNDPPVKLVDWQFVAQGRGVIDVAYFLIRSVPPDQRRQMEHSLLQTYHTLLIQNGVRDYDFDVCWAEYQRAFFWPFLVVVGAVSIGGKTFIQKPARLKVTLERLIAFIEHHTVEVLLSK